MQYLSGHKAVRDEGQLRHNNGGQATPGAGKPVTNKAGKSSFFTNQVGQARHKSGGQVLLKPK
jgi:hypothetical protein